MRDFEEIEGDIEYWVRQRDRHLFAIDEADEEISNLYKELRDVDQ